MDATAARGIIDRRGLFKVCRPDVNLLWLQEQLARDKVPLIKVPGLEINADLIKTHLLAEVICRLTTWMSLEFRGGRSQKAAILQSVIARVSDARSREQRQQEARDKMHAVCDRYAERHGGDSWRSRGAD